MENINDYLIIIAVLMAFYLILMLYLKYGYHSSQFTFIPDITTPSQLVPILAEPDIYLTEDTRIQYPLLPPVSPMIRQRVIRNTIPASPDLYTSQTFDSSDYILDTPPTQDTNELYYSGGETQMISVPLQFNYPYNEQLRSQDILITPYNKIKYGNC